MRNINKVLIVILVLFLIILFRKKNIFEKFFDEKYLLNDFMNKDFAHSNLSSNIYIEFYYKDGCSISRQFMYGCCKAYGTTQNANTITDSDIYSIEKKGPSNVSMSSNSLYDYDFSDAPMHTVTDETDNPRYDESHCMDHHGNQLKSCFYQAQDPDPMVDISKPIGRSADYVSEASCMPIEYFNLLDTNGAEKNGCILQENLNGLTKPTFYYLKRFIDFVNNFYKRNVIDVIDPEGGNTINRFEVEKDGVTEYKLYRNNKEFFDFHIHLKTISSANTSQTKGITLFPLLKVKFLNKIIPEKEEPDNLNFTEYDYMGDVNNLCGVVSFLQEKIKLHFTPNSIDFKLDSILLGKKLKNFQTDYARVTLFDDFNNFNRLQSNNVIEKLFTDYKEELGRAEFECPIVSAVPFNLNQKFRDDDVEQRKVSRDNYLFKRPKIYLNNASYNTDSLLIIFRDRFLQEDYNNLSSDGVSERKKLIYWMMWNIPPQTRFIKEKYYDNLENRNSKEFTELFAYQLFDPEKYPQLINKIGTDYFNQDITENFTENMLDRQIEVEMKVKELTVKQRKKLNEMYYKCRDSNIQDFYKFIYDTHTVTGENDFNGFKYIDEDIDNFKETRTDLAGDTWEKTFYTIKYRLSQEQYRKLFKYQNNIAKQTNLRKILTVKSSTNYTNNVSADREKTIHLGRKTNWVITWLSVRESNLHIGSYHVLGSNNTDNIKMVFRIPGKVDNIDIKSNRNCNLSFFESRNATQELNWGDMLTITNDNINNEQYGLRNTHNSEAKKFKCYTCMGRKTNYIINFSIVNRGANITKIALNGKLFYQNNAGCNFRYITDKSDKMDFLIELGSNCVLNNGTITELDAIDLDYSKLNKPVPGEFVVVNEEKFLTIKKSGVYEMKDRLFKLPKKSNYLLQLKIKYPDSLDIFDINGDSLIRQLNENNESEIKPNIDGFFNMELLEVDELKIHIKTNDANNKAMIFFGKIVEIDTIGIEGKRVLNINHDILNCQNMNHIPKISWNYFNTENFSKNNTVYGDFNNNVKYGVEIFNNDDENQVYYLEWDIKDMHTKGDHFRNQYGINFNRSNKDEFSKISDIDDTDSLKRIVGNNIYEQGESPNFKKKIDTRSMVFGKYHNTVTSNSKECHVINLPHISNNPTFPNTILLFFTPSPFDRGSLNMDFFSNSEDYSIFGYKNEGLGYYLEYNKNLKKWMMWKKDNENSNFKLWFGAQAESKNIFSGEELIWLFSPRFSNKSFNFYDYPNPADDLKDVDINDDKLLKVKITITPNSNYKNLISCENTFRNGIPLIASGEEVNDNVFKKDKINHYGSRFKNTLFNFIGKINLESDQDKFEVYEYKDGNNNENARLVYNLKLRCRVTTYCDKEFANSRGQMIILEGGRFIQNRGVENFNTTKMANQTIIRKSDNSHKNYERVLSQMVKTNYIQKEIIDRVSVYIKSSIETLIRNTAPNLRESIFNIGTNKKITTEQQIVDEIKHRVFIEIDDCLTQILINRGDLSKVDKIYIPNDLLEQYNSRLFYSMDENDDRILMNPSSKPVILVNSNLDEELVKIYREYVNHNDHKLLHDNFSSFGGLNLNQNETMIIYRIPIDINCPKFKQSISCVPSDTTDNIILTIKQKEAEFLQSFNIIRNMLIEADNFLFPDSEDSNYIYNFFRTLQTDGFITRMDRETDYPYIQNTEVINLQVRIIQLILYIEEKFNTFDTQILQLNNLIRMNTGELKQTYINRKNNKKTELRNSIKNQLIELVFLRNDLNIINQRFNVIGIDMFTTERILPTQIEGFTGQINTTNPSPTPTPTESNRPSPETPVILREQDIPDFESKEELESKLLRFFGSQINSPYLNRAGLQKPYEAEIFLKLYRRFTNNFDFSEAPESSSPSPSPAMIQANDFEEGRLQVENYQLPIIYLLRRDNSGEISLVIEDIRRNEEEYLSRFAATNIVNRLTTFEIERNRTIELCKLIDQIQQEINLFENITTSVNTGRVSISDLNNQRFDDYFNRLRRFYGVLRAIKTLQENYSIQESNCNSTITIAESPSPANGDFDDDLKFLREDEYIQVQNLFNFLELGNDLDDFFPDDESESLRDNCPNPSPSPGPSPSFCGSDLSSNIINRIKSIYDDNRLRQNLLNSINTFITGTLERTNQTIGRLTNLKNNMIQEKNRLDQKVLRDLGILNSILRNTIGTSTIQRLGDIQAKINGLTDSIQQRQTVLNSLNELLTQGGITETLEKITKYLTLQRDILPIINTYSKQFFKLKRKFRNLRDKFNEISLSSNQSQILEKKKLIIQEHSQDIQLLNILSSELKGKSDFLLIRYRQLGLGTIERLPDMASSGMSGFQEELMSEALEFEDRSEEQMAAYEATKKPLKPKEIAKYYKDMIFNILN